MRVLKVVVAVSLFLITPLTAKAQIAKPIGGEFQVNTYDPPSMDTAKVAMLADGNFVFIYQSEGSSDTDTDGSAILGQLFSSSGTKIGSEFQVNSYTSGDQEHPDVETCDGQNNTCEPGEYIVTWQSDGSSGSDDSGLVIVGQFLRGAGEKIGDEFQVNSYTTNNQGHPSVEMCDGQNNTCDAGEFVVAWQSYGSGGSDNSGYSIQLQRFNSSGAPSASVFQVNSFTSNWQSKPYVEATGSGFFVTWGSEGSAGGDSSSTSIQGQLYASDGSPVGGEIQINSYTTNSQRRPSAASLLDFEYVVVWDGQGPEGNEIWARRYSSDGTQVGFDLIVNTYTSSTQERAKVSSSDDGYFVVVWEGFGSAGRTDTHLRSVHGRLFSPDFVGIGDEFQVNSYTTDFQWYPAVDMNPAGDFVVVWRNSGTNVAYPSFVQAQIYGGPSIFSDDFEAGDTSLWIGSP